MLGRESTEERRRRREKMPGRESTEERKDGKRKGKAAVDKQGGR